MRGTKVKKLRWLFRAIHPKGFQLRRNEETKVVSGNLWRAFKKANS